MKKLNTSKVAFSLGFKSTGSKKTMQRIILKRVAPINNGKISFLPDENLKFTIEYTINTVIK
ncbi:hypothetical protein [Planktosalinus lacus]|uniref:hypothetical protein n=1 Tax=Planktosalinus lacus TaxID=1526573 RepID=UPI001668C123|nr:hypothetical protein [Planktosalinus lacus]